MSSRMFMQCRYAPLRIKKALGIFGPLENWLQEQEKSEIPSTGV